MKKTILGIALIPLALTACGKPAGTTSAGIGGEKDELYAGILPAADAAGILYTLRLDYDDDHNYTDGDYLLTETALVKDSVNPLGLKDGVTSLTEGDFRIESRTVNGTTSHYLRLMPDMKESLGAASASTLCFLINPDRTLTMVNADLTKAANGTLNYTLTLKN